MRICVIPCDGEVPCPKGALIPILTCLPLSPALDFQYAMFLSLVFLAELVAGISGFVFRHEVSIHKVENSLRGSLGGGVLELPVMCEGPIEASCHLRWYRCFPNVTS